MRVPKFVSRFFLPACAVAFALCALPVAASQAEPTTADTLLIEPETFVALGSWQRTGDTIQSANMPAVAFAGFNVTQAGEYRVWTRSQDYPASQPGTRRFLIRIDEQPMARESGAHGQAGWYWEQVGTIQLEPGLHLLEIDDTTRFYGRLEAIFITATDLNPNDENRRALNRFNYEVVQPERVAGGEAVAVAAPAAGVEAVGSLQNENLVIDFLPVTTANGETRVWRRSRFTDKEGEQTAVVEAGVEPLLLISRPLDAPEASFSAWFPNWPNQEETLWQLGDRRLRRPADDRDPFAAGKVTALYPYEVQAGEGDSVLVSYRSEDGQQSATALWTLPQEGHSARVDANVAVAQSAFYSLGFGVGTDLAREQVSAVQLPPLYQFRRLPNEPTVIGSSLTPHPLALLESSALTGEPVSFGVVAAADTITGQWPTRTNASHGFSLVGQQGEPRPFIFTPVLAGKGSERKDGEALQGSWYVAAAPLPWGELMREVDTQLYNLSDYREPVSVSTTEQALNIIDLIADPEASGWDPVLKGPANIESPLTVSHSAPLIYFSVAQLTEDEDFYRDFALPTLEYLLSRPGAHFALTAEGNLYVTEVTAKIDFNHLFYASAVWQGVDALLGGLNPWLQAYASKDGAPLGNRNNSAEPVWSGLLALYRQNPSPELLAKIKHEANGWIARVGQLNMTVPRGIQPFYNVAFYPYWWDLLDLYELTDDAQYLEAARNFAWQTAAGLWATPAVPEHSEMTTLYPDNHIGGAYHVWWTGNERGRHGWTLSDQQKRSKTLARIDIEVPQKEVPAWVVSPAGLGIEQPISYLTAADQMSNIQLNSYAAVLLRLAAATGEDYWKVLARNGVIGRGGSYPGYYLSNYQDFVQDKDYPRNGPDINGFYWHHVPVHLAMLVDFIVADAETRTGGAIRFPYVKQQGYVWFTNRIYGAQAGSIFGDDTARLLFDRERFGVDSHKVDHFGARGEKAFHLVALNQSQEAEQVRAHVNAEALGLQHPQTALLRTSADDAGTRVTAEADGTFALDLERGAWAVLSFEAVEDASLAAGLEPLKTQPVSFKPDNSAWGEGRLFRIRSPFGKDSVYLVLSGRAQDGVMRVRVTDAEGGEIAALESAAYPYEVSHYGIAPQEDAIVTLELQLPDSAQTETLTFTLPGTH